MVNEKKAIFTIGIAAQMLELHPRTLRIYEEEGLIKPMRKGKWRYYTMNDIKWIECLREMIHEHGISIPVHVFHDTEDARLRIHRSACAVRCDPDLGEVVTHEVRTHHGRGGLPAARGGGTGEVGDPSARPPHARDEHVL